jgi:predicted phage tail protein
MTKLLHGAGGGGGSSKKVTNSPDTLRSQDTVEFTLGLVEGPIAGLIDGPKTFYLGDTPLVSQNNDNNFDSFELHMYHGSADASVVKNALGGVSSSTTVGMNLAEATPVTRITPAVLINTIDILEIRLVFSQLFEVASDGAQRETQALFKLKYRQEGESEWINWATEGQVQKLQIRSTTTTQGSGRDGDFTNTKTTVNDLRQTGRLPGLTAVGSLADTSFSTYTQSVTGTFGKFYFAGPSGAYAYVATPGSSDLVLTPELDTFVTNQGDISVTIKGPEIISLRGKTTSQYVKELSKRVPRIDGNWEIQLTKVSADNNENLYVNMTWESFQCVTKADRSYDNLAVIRGLGVATDQFSNLPAFSGVFAGRVVKVPSNYDTVTRVYTGSWDGTFKDAHTSNPAWCAYDLLVNENYGVKAHYPALMVDRFSFYAGAQWCDVLVPRPGGGFQPRYTYNDHIKDSRQGLELVYYIVALFGGMITEDLNGTIILKVDKPTALSQIFGVESTTGDGFNYQKTDITTRANIIEVRFINPNLDFNEDIRSVQDQTLIDRNGRISLPLVAVGCLDVFEAQRRAQLRLISANTEVTMVSFSTARQGILLEPLDFIGISDSSMKWGASGRIKTVTGSTIELRDKIYLNRNSDLVCDIQTPSGIQTITVQNQGDGPYATSLEITAGTIPADLPDRAQFTLGSTVDLGLVKPFRILSINPADNEPDNYRIVAVEVNLNKYDDADNMASSGTVEYAFKATDRPDPPFGIFIASGTEHLFVTPSGTINSRIYLSWEQNPLSFTENFQISYRRLDLESFSTFNTTGTDTYIENVQDGVPYEIFIQSRSIMGKLSARSALIQHSVVGKLARPTSITGATSVQLGADVKLTIDAILDLDLKHYLIKVDDDLIGTSTTNTFRHKDVSGSSLNYEITAEDTSGNLSLVPYEFTHTIPVPGTPSVAGQFSGENYQIYITPNPTVVVPVAEYIITSNGVEVFRGAASNFRSKAFWLGSKTFEIRSVSTAGEVSSAATVTLTITAPGAIALAAQIVETNYRLTWTKPPSTLPIDYYVVTDVSTGQVIDDDLRATTFTAGIYWVGTTQLSVVAVDTAGNLGIVETQSLGIVAPSVTGFSAAVSKSMLILSWQGNKGSLPLKQFHLYEGESLISTLDATAYNKEVDWHGVKLFKVQVEDILGNLSPFVTHTETIDAPTAPSPSAVIVDQDVVLTWEEPGSEMKISHYDISQDDVIVGQVSATRFSFAATFLGTVAFSVVAVDIAGNSGTAGVVLLEVLAPSNFTVGWEVENQRIRMLWDQPTSDLPLLEYIVKREGSEIARVTSKSYALYPDWVGLEEFSVVAVDTAGNTSPGASTSVEVIAPSGPSIVPEVLDNNVLLRWSNGSGTFPVGKTEIRKGAVFDTAVVQQEVDANFAAFFEFKGGTYDYWLVNIDTSGNYGAGVKTTVFVTEPPDYILQDDFNSSFTGNLTNMVSSEEGLFFGVDPNQTFAQHFTDNGFASPQAQINAGLPFYMQPTDPSTTSKYVEYIDYGVVIPSTIIQVTPTLTQLAGDGRIQTDIEYRETTSDSWISLTDVSQAYAQNFQYARITLTLIADTGDDLIKMTALNVRLSTKIRSDAGNGSSLASESSGTTVNFDVDFLDVKSISVTPNTTSPVIGIYDFLDVPSPTTFSVYLFDKDGVRVSGDFSWTARGF